MRDVVDQLRAKREARRETLDDVAQRLDVHKGTLSRYENGGIEPTLSMLVRWAETLDIRLDIRFASLSSEPDLWVDEGSLSPGQRRLVQSVLDVAPGLSDEHADTLARTIRLLSRP